MPWKSQGKLREFSWLKNVATLLMVLLVYLLIARDHIQNLSFMPSVRQTLIVGAVAFRMPCKVNYHLEHNH